MLIQAQIKSEQDQVNISQYIYFQSFQMNLQVQMYPPEHTSLYIMIWIFIIKAFKYSFCMSIIKICNVFYI